MMTRKLPRFSTAFVLCTPACALALGLGEIELRSSLNQIFQGKIDLHALEEGDLDTLSVNIASPRAFAQAGIERLAVLSDFEFAVEKDGGGRPYLMVTSKRPIREPVLEFLIELEWSKGRLVREFAVLLDPSPLIADPSAPIVGRPIEAALNRKRLAPSTPPDPSPAYGAGEAYGPVQRGETLWGIAERFRADPSISMERMMEAIFETNPHAFAKANRNHLRAGATLQIPVFEGFPAPAAPAQEGLATNGAAPEEGAVAQAAAPGGAQVRLTDPGAGDGLQPEDEGRSESGAGGFATPVVDLPVRINIDGNQLQLQVAGIEDLRTRIGALVGVDNSALTAIQDGATARKPEIPAGPIELPEIELTAGAAIGEDARGAVDSSSTAAPLDLRAESQFQEVGPEATLTQGESVAFDQVQSGAAEFLEFSEFQTDLAAQEAQAGSGLLLGEVPAIVSGEQPEALPTPETQPSAISEQSSTASTSESPDTSPVVESPQPVPAAKPLFPTTRDLGLVGAATAVLRNPAILLEQPAALLRDPLLLVLLGVGFLSGLALLTGLLALPFMLWKRRQAAEGVAEGQADEFERITESDPVFDPAFEQGVTGESDAHGLAPTQAVSAGAMSPAADPLERADLLIAVANYREAESMVRQALVEDPTNTALAVKLLDVLFANGDAKGFLDEAEIMFERLKKAPGAQWGHVAELGRQLCPHEPLFDDMANTESAGSGASGLDLGKGTRPDELLNGSTSGGLGFNSARFSKAVPPAPSGFADNGGLNAPGSDDMGDLEWQLPEEPAENEKPKGERPADEQAPFAGEAHGSDEFERQLRNLDFELDDLLGQEPGAGLGQAGEKRSRGRVGEDELLSGDEAWRKQDPEVDEDLETQLRSLGFGLNSPSARGHDAGNDEKGELDGSGGDDFFAPVATPGTDPGDDDLAAELKDFDFELEEMPGDQDRLSQEDKAMSGSEATAGGEAVQQGSDDFIETKLDLAKAYLEMEDRIGASGLLDEVMKEGTTDQKQRAEALIKRVQALKA